MSDHGKVVTVLENFAVVDHHTCKSTTPLSATWQIFSDQPRSEDTTKVSCCQHNQSVHHIDKHRQSSKELSPWDGQLDQESLL